MTYVRLSIVLSPPVCVRAVTENECKADSGPQGATPLCSMTQSFQQFQILLNSVSNHITLPRQKNVSRVGDMKENPDKIYATDSLDYQWLKIQRKIMMPWDGTIEHPMEILVVCFGQVSSKCSSSLILILMRERSVLVINSGSVMQFIICPGEPFYEQIGLLVFITCLYHIFPLYVASTRHFCKTK